MGVDTGDVTLRTTTCCAGHGSTTLACVRPTLTVTATFRRCRCWALSEFVFDAIPIACAEARGWMHTHCTTQPFAGTSHLDAQRSQLIDITNNVREGVSWVFRWKTHPTLA